MRDSRPKTAYLVAVSVEWLLRRFQRCTFVTITAKECLADLHEAKRRFIPVANWFRRKNLVGVGVWQLQRRGAWHLHVLVSGRVEVAELRPFAVARGWGSQLNVKAVYAYKNRPETFALQVKRLGDYVSRYVTRDLSGNRGYQLVTYVGGARCGTVRFGWVGGVAKVWRIGCEMFYEMFKRFPRWGDSEFVLRLGLECVWGQSGFEWVAEHPALGGRLLDSS
jgi:hypothetical protein